MTQNWPFAKITDILQKNWGQWSYLKTTISTKSLMSIPFVKSGLHPNRNLCIPFDANIYVFFCQIGIVSFYSFCINLSLIPNNYCKWFKCIGCNHTVYKLLPALDAISAIQSVLSSCIYHKKEEENMQEYIQLKWMPVFDAEFVLPVLDAEDPWNNGADGNSLNIYQHKTMF